MRGAGANIVGWIARRGDATRGAASRVRARLARLAPARRWAVLGALAAGSLAVVLVLLLTATDVVVLAPGDEAAGPPGSVAAGVPLPAAGASPETADDPIAAAQARPGAGLSVPAATAEAFAHIPPVRQVTALAEAADPALLERTEGLILPRKGDDGRVPWRAYAHPFAGGDDRPRIAIVIAGLGLAAAATDAAVARLPGAVSLAFAPGAADLATQIRGARRFGHETLAMLPLQSADFPFEDAGPGTLRADAEEAQNLQRLQTVLAAAPASVGVLAVGGSRFARSDEAVRPVLGELADRGLLLADASGDGSALLAAQAARLEVPRVLIDTVIDDAVDAAAIDARLAELEAQARRSHVAVGLARPLPISLARLRAWIDTLPAKGLALAPVTAIVGTQIRTDAAALGAAR